MTTRQECEQCLSAITDDSLLAITLHHLLKQVDAQNEIDEDDTDLDTTQPEVWACRECGKSSDGPVCDDCQPI